MLLVCLDRYGRLLAYGRQRPGAIDTKAVSGDMAEEYATIGR